MHITTHNGIWTVTSKKTGQHRTFRIETWVKKDDKPRVVSLLVGSDNGKDYRGFGFVNNDGRIFVWKKHRGTMFDQYADMLQKLPALVENGTVEVLHEGRCRMCNRRLTVPESIESGIGPTCATR